MRGLDAGLAFWLVPWVCLAGSDRMECVLSGGLGGSSMGAIFFSGFGGFYGSYGHVIVRMLLTCSLFSLLFCIWGRVILSSIWDEVILCVG